MSAVEQDACDAKMAAMTLPQRGTCIEDAEIAIMDGTYFDGLAEYSCSMPSGVYIGKRWKRNDTAYNHLRGLSPAPSRWVMGEYEKTADPHKAATRWREIVVL